MFEKDLKPNLWVSACTKSGERLNLANNGTLLIKSARSVIRLIGESVLGPMFAAVLLSRGHQIKVLNALKQISTAFHAFVCRNSRACGTH